MPSSIYVNNGKELRILQEALCEKFGLDSYDVLVGSAFPDSSLETQIQNLKPEFLVNLLRQVDGWRVELDLEFEQNVHDEIMAFRSSLQQNARWERARRWASEKGISMSRYIELYGKP